jgi:histidinol phosphatase-like enzyme (inositol monophosphatase family)
MHQVDPQLLEQAVGWARSAGELTLGWFNHAELDVDAKGDGTPVTQADRAAERLLREMILADFPDDTIIGEEEVDHVGSSGRTWVIDPIDGTKAFTHGVATYSNLLYLEDEHGPAIGVINLPALGETVYAGRGRGCFLDGARVTVSDRRELAGSYLCCTGFHEWTPEMFERVQSAGVELRTWGDAYGYALVASGRADAMFDPVLAWWDIASLTVIVPEAGGRLTSWHGSDELLHAEHGHYTAIASNGAFHDELVGLLAP